MSDCLTCIGLCCKKFKLNYLYDGEPVMVSWGELPYFWRMMTVPLPFNSGCFICVLQSVDGNCLIHEGKPLLCRNFRCNSNLYGERI